MARRPQGGGSRGDIVTSRAPGWDPADSAVYLTYADAFVPRRREQSSAVLDLLRAAPGHRLLELGCGDGRLTEELMESMPGIHVTAIDAAPEMLSQARERLARFAGRLEIRQAVIEDSTSFSPGGYDAVVTSLALHHLDDRAKRATYQDIIRALRPGGAFVMADLIRPAGAAALTMATRQWDAEVSHAGHAAAEAFARTTWNTFRFPDPADRPAAVSEHLRWLEQAGFAAVDVCWAYAGHAVIYARRPENQE
jgi:tRNA (cmo5U34)-methyltransferase